ncbi:uncharacterized protein LOC143199418 isoform X2 [Rhynchophorus ferrugineus]|uniref:uncharacterized protein LOC143199418 isoform X2 n=1 Tax=Rhynchophorus ferrugineus TaxID=354439 RepID=UPI003FCE0871
MFPHKLLLIVYVLYVQCEDAFYNVNTKKVFHTVSDKFLSLSIDPGLLLIGVNLSDSSLLLARHLGPAYIRLVGPSTPYVRFVEDDDQLSRRDLTEVLISPSMWFGINEWFNLAKLTPVFGINDAATLKGTWDADTLLPLLEMSDQFSINCYWQLGYECSNKTVVQYIDDLNVLRQALKRFPGHDDSWKVAGSDLSKCAFDEVANGNLENYFRDLEQTVDAILWESPLISKNDLGLDKVSMWTVMPKDLSPVTFKSAMEWTQRVEEAAYAGYDVIFREPRLREITRDSPVYWASWLHKKLMGAKVLDTKPMFSNNDLQAFAHCAKNQNSYARSGAVTVLVINNSTTEGNAHIHLAHALTEKSMEIQTYLLTSTLEDPGVFLNDEKLTMDRLRTSPDAILKPKLRRAKIKSHIPLEVPANSIAYFVLAGARCSLCSDGEEELDNILAEINEDQGDASSGEVAFNIEQRMRETGPSNKITLEEIKKSMLDEMESDQNYYDKMVNKAGGRSRSSSGRNDVLNRNLKTYLEKARKAGVDKKPAGEKYSDFRVPSNSLFLTVQEIESILKQRARAKAAQKNIKLSSAELDMLVNKATIRLPRQRRDINHVLLDEKAIFHKNNQFSQEQFEKFFKENKNSRRPAKRDINLDLLKKKTKPEAGLGRSKTAKQSKVSPLRKYWEEQEAKHRRMDVKDDSEIFKNFMDSDELDSYDFGKGARTFVDLTSSEQAASSEWFQPIKTKCKHKSPFGTNISPNARSKTKEYSSRDGFHFMEQSDEDEDDAGGHSHVKKLGWSWNDPSKKFSELWEMKYGQNEKTYNDMSVFNGLDEFNVFDDLDYAIMRSKRHINPIVRSKTNRIMCKRNCLKVPNKKQQEKSTKGPLITNRIATATGTEVNEIPRSRSTRSLLDNKLFGYYKPLTLGLKPWKPVDMIGLAQNPNLFPLFARFHDQNLGNSLLPPTYLGLGRKRRYIETNRLQSVENFIDSREMSREQTYTYPPTSRQWTLPSKQEPNDDDVNEKQSDKKPSSIIAKDEQDNTIVNDHPISSKQEHDDDDVSEKQNHKKLSNIIVKDDEHHTTDNDLISSKQEYDDDDDDDSEKQFDEKPSNIIVKDEEHHTTDNNHPISPKQEHNDRDVNDKQSVSDHSTTVGSVTHPHQDPTIQEYSSKSGDDFNLLKNEFEKDILTQARDNLIRKEELLEDQMGILGNVRNSTLNSVEGIVSQTRKILDSTEKAALQSPNYLEKIFGKTNVKYLENFANKMKNYFDSVGRNVKSFFSSIF